ncbi:large conductance mechanosensitive channel protein MscL [Salinimicrobium sediminilitoris]|uniref:large conductance mechanosensitive channel protein MscL n=1 Tax=Salinimicrobium sediminilitoris TaxID=2876715 RepID=UPI001E31C324|nr:large conductance mechanosensitive channel protein MscL [Salinimicrobium sediminilitoris]MCC8360375.1 large conductance mechanosensitive channel protein MscL [Salinimicrobium sediminilitoris]
MAKGFFQEFKEFAVKGNMIDMAVGIIIGTAFNRVVDVLVKQVVMPPLSMLTGKIDYGDRKYVLKEAVPATDGAEAVEEIAVGYGLLIEVFIDFLVIGLTVFLVVKFMNRFRRKAEDTKDKTVATPKDIELLTNLKELMQEQNELLKKNNS